MNSTDACALSTVLIGAQQGDRAARAQLARLLTTELAPLIARAARALPRVELDDVRQDTFLLLVEPRVEFDPRRGPARAYCFHAARSAADFGGQARARRRWSETNPDDLIAAERGRPMVDVCDELAAARDIDPSLFALMVLIERDGITAKNAGARVGMTPWRICRALQRYSTRCQDALRLSSQAA